MLTDNLQLKDDQYKEKANKTTNNKLDRGHWIVTQYRGRGRRKKKGKKKRRKQYIMMSSKTRKSIDGRDDVLCYSETEREGRKITCSNPFV